MISAMFNGFCQGAYGSATSNLGSKAVLGENPPPSNTTTKIKESPQVSLNSNAAQPPHSHSPVDLTQHTLEAISDARSGNWVDAAFKSMEVAQDIMDCSKDVGEAFVQSRTDAVKGDYATNSDIGFQ